jgi:hypothetical protein
MAAEPSSARRPALGRAVVPVCLVGLALIGALTSPFHWSSATMVAAVAIVAAVLALCPSRFLPWARPGDNGVGGTPRPAMRGSASTSAALRRGLIAWSLLLVALLAWQGYAYLRQPDRSIAHDDYPTLSTLLDPLLEQGPVRYAGWLAWLAAGWWLVRR